MDLVEFGVADEGLPAPKRGSGRNESPADSAKERAKARWIGLLCASGDSASERDRHSEKVEGAQLQGVSFYPYYDEITPTRVPAFSGAQLVSGVKLGGHESDLTIPECGLVIMLHTCAVVNCGCCFLLRE